MGRKTSFEVVREYFPEASDKECDFILWEKTAFPVAGEETIRKQLQEYKESTDKNS